MHGNMLHLSISPIRPDTSALPFWPFREFLLQRGIMLRTPLWLCDVCVRCSSDSLMAKEDYGQMAQVCVYVCKRGNTL